MPAESNLEAASTATSQASDQIEPITFERTVTILHEKMVGWFDTAVALLPNLLVALVILFIAYAVGAVISRVMHKIFSKSIDSEAVANLFTTIIKIVVLALGFFTALELVGLQKAVVSLLAGAGIIGLAIGFAFQDLAENFLAGLLMGIRKPFETGHLIQSNDQFGFIQKLNLRNTILRNFSGQIIYIPNKEVFKTVLINYSKSGERRIELAVGVSYGEDLKNVTEVIKDAIGGLDFLKSDKPVDVFAMEFGDSSINFSVRYWIEYPDGKAGYFTAIDQGIKAIKAAFDEKDILIPFPIRTLDFDAKGGINLTDSLEPVMSESHEASAKEKKSGHSDTGEESES